MRSIVGTTSTSMSLTSQEGIFSLPIMAILIWIIIIIITMLTLQGLILGIIVTIPPCMGRYGLNWTRSRKVHKWSLRVCFWFLQNEVNISLTALKIGRKATTLSLVSTNIFVLLSNKCFPTLYSYRASQKTKQLLKLLQLLKVWTLENNTNIFVLTKDKVGKHLLESICSLCTL